jgi:hypothetical protein
MRKKKENQPPAHLGLAILPLGAVRLPSPVGEGGREPRPRPDEGLV